MQTATEIVTEICMSRDARPWLAVEGDSDERLLRKRSFPKDPKIVIGNGWEGVRYIICECYKENSSAKLLGLMDRDYRDHLGNQIFHEYIVLTDFRDIENILFNSSALDRVISEYSSSNKIPKNNDKINIESIRHHIYDSAVKIGRFRVYCQYKEKYIDFKKIDYAKFISDKDLKINVEKFLSHLNGKNPGKTLLKSHWEEAQSIAWRDKLNQPQFIANGHDIMALLAIALRRMWGTIGGSITKESIESSFRIGFSDEDLKSFSFWHGITEFLAE